MYFIIPQSEVSYLPGVRFILGSQRDQCDWKWLSCVLWTAQDCAIVLYCVIPPHSLAWVPRYLTVLIGSKFPLLNANGYSDRAISVVRNKRSCILGTDHQAGPCDNKAHGFCHNKIWQRSWRPAHRLPFLALISTCTRRAALVNKLVCDN